MIGLDPTRPDPPYSNWPVRHGFHACQVDWPRGVSHGSTTKAHGSKHVIVATLVCWLVLGPSYFSGNVCSVLFCLLYFFVFFCSILWFTPKKMKRTAHIRALTCVCRPTPRCNSSYPMASASAPAGDRASCAASGPCKQPSCAASGSNT